MGVSEIEIRLLCVEVRVPISHQRPPISQTRTNSATWHRAWVAPRMTAIAQGSNVARWHGWRRLPQASLRMLVEDPAVRRSTSWQ